jgi:hypothetical protein
MSSTVRLIEAGEAFEDTAGGPLVIRAVQQRNWSRVGVATARDSEDPVYFLKQFIAADGSVSSGGASAEAKAATLGRAAFGDCVLVPEFADEDRVLLAYPHRRFAATDQLLREDPAGLDAAWEAFCTDLAGIIAATTTVPAELLHGLRERPQGRPGEVRALAFKALEVRNIAPRIDGKQPLLIFDLGPAYVSTVTDVAARLLVSVLLLNWGRPMSRFVKGPPTRLASLAAQQWLPYLDRDIVASAFRKEVAMRRDSIQGTSRRERWAKAVGVATVGARYEVLARNWVRRTLS